MPSVKGKLTEAIPLHRVLREIYRHYPEFRSHVGSTGNHVITHSYYLYEEDGQTIKEKITVTISFYDLRDGLQKLSRRKREAVFYNVILDWKQKDVAKKMGITTVSVGQYVEQACIQLAQEYFSEALQEGEKSSERQDHGDRLGSKRKRATSKGHALRKTQEPVAVPTKAIRGATKKNAVSG